jgi:hypothetical protein
MPHDDLIVYAFTAIGGVVLCQALYQSKLTPPALALFGVFGYFVLLASIPADLLNFVTK